MEWRLHTRGEGRINRLYSVRNKHCTEKRKGISTKRQDTTERGHPTERKYTRSGDTKVEGTYTRGTYMVRRSHGR